jgi:N-acetylmuramoyl-L-alanine amidase
MLKRADVAGFLQGLFVLPLCALFGGLVGLLFKAHGFGLWACVGFCALFPIFGAIKTKQKALLAGLLVGVIVSIGLLIAVVPAHAEEPPLPLHGFVVCLDPGHVSETSAGTVSRDGRLTEAHVNWVIGQRLTRLLKAEGATVVPTKLRESQVVPNQRRAEIANAAHANLFLRLHCDSGEQSGVATYYPDRQGRRFGVTGPSLEVMESSRRTAQSFQPAVAAALRGALRDAGIKGDSQTGVGSKQGALTGSIFSHVPALTIEMCVLTNAHDYRFINTPSGEDRMAHALLAGVEAVAVLEREK